MSKRKKYSSYHFVYFFIINAIFQLSSVAIVFIAIFPLWPEVNRIVMIDCFWRLKDKF